LFDLTREANLYLEENQTEIEVIDAFMEQITTLLDVLGIKLEQEELLDEEIDALIAERNEARKARNFERADEIRDLLKEKNIILEDTAQGVRWRRG
ncbi:MAG TPA: DALR domain-containing protein, partial [Pseudogracilibacillus sp.]|nr:DALR domain-containing protein [Pseudogracilibacillus sp.]